MDQIPADFLKAILGSLPKGPLDAFLKPPVTMEWPEPWICEGFPEPAQEVAATELVTVSIGTKATAFTVAEGVRQEMEDYERRIHDPQDLEDGLLAVKRDALVSRVQADMIEAHNAGFMAALGIPQQKPQIPLPPGLSA